VSATDERLVVDKPYRKSECLATVRVCCEEDRIVIPLTLHQARYLLLRARDKDDQLSLACTATSDGVQAAVLEHTEQTRILLLGLLRVRSDLCLNCRRASSLEDDRKIDVGNRHGRDDGARVAAEEEAAEVEKEGVAKQSDHARE
jgi:hypothetical protein